MEKSDSKPEKYSPQAFRDEFHKFISGKKAAAEGHPPKPEQQHLAGVSDIEKSVVSATKTCSVKLVDIGPKTTPATINASTNNSDHNNITDESSGDSQVETLKRDHLPPHSLETSDDSDEPNPKRVRPSLPEPGRVLLKPKDFIDLKKRTVSSSSLDSSRLKSTKPTSEGHSNKSSTSSAFDNVEEELGRLFGASSPQKKDNNSSKVTISPVRSSSSNTKETELCKSGANNSSSSSSSSSMMMSSSPMNTTTNNTPNSTSSSSGSVTITKLSTGSSLSVESKDLKTILSSSGGNRALSTSGNNSSSIKSSSNTNSSNNLENGFKLNKKNVDIVSMSGSSTTNSNKDQLSPTDR